MRSPTVWARTILPLLRPGRRSGIREKFGFFHDPSLTTWAEYVGWDVESDVPERWYELSRDTYRDDLARYVGDTYMGPRGLGYDT